MHRVPQNLAVVNSSYYRLAFTNNVRVVLRGYSRYSDGTIVIDVLFVSVSCRGRGNG